jgi:hypothetical protein
MAAGGLESAMPSTEQHRSPAGAEVRRGEVRVPVAVKVTNRDRARITGDGTVDRGLKRPVAATEQDGDPAPACKHKVGVPVTVDVADRDPVAATFDVIGERPVEGAIAACP